MREAVLTPEMVAKERERRARRLLEYAGLPRRYQWARFGASGFEMNEAARQAQAWVNALPEPRFEVRLPEYYNDGVSVAFVRIANVLDDIDEEGYVAQAIPPELPSTGLILSGPVGTGKTALLVATLRAAIERTLARGRFWPAVELLDALRPTDTGGPKWQLESIIDEPLLAVDDLGVGRVTDFVVETWERIIDARYREARPLLLTTNLTRRELTDTLGSRVASRLAEMCEPIVLSGEDRRLRKAGA